jgi:hypothetical protein
LVAALLVGAGVVGAVWLMVRRAGRRRRVMDEGMRGGLSKGEAAGVLRESVIGQDKQMVQSVFGPPRAAAGGVAKVPGEGRQAYWEADVWYYALDPKERMAMAITFEEGVAREVEFVAGGA